MLESRRRGQARRLTVGVGLIALILVAPARPALARGDALQTVSSVAWEPCGDGLECATVVVPRNYSQPTDGTFDLALIRSPAFAPQQRLGSLFLNPGGPG